MVTGLIFKERKTVNIQLKDSDRAQELIGYLNEMQEIKKDVSATANSNANE
jgi:hypothetical protein